jgi:hypothetical protein
MEAGMGLLSVAPARDRGSGEDLAQQELLRRIRQGWRREAILKHFEARLVRLIEDNRRVHDKIGSYARRRDNGAVRFDRAKQFSSSRRPRESSRIKEAARSTPEGGHAVSAPPLRTSHPEVGARVAGAGNDDHQFQPIVPEKMMSKEKKSVDRWTSMPHRANGPLHISPGRRPGGNTRPYPEGQGPAPSGCRKTPPCPIPMSDLLAFISAGSFHVPAHPCQRPDAPKPF